MAPTISIEDPHAVLTLPGKSRDPKAGHRFGEVFSVNGVQRRRRTEIVVGIDCECLCLYNIQTPFLITSYAIPPQTALCASPCSIYQKLASTDKATRYTYAAVQSVHGIPSHYIVSYVETVGDSSTFAPAKSTYEIGSADDPVIHIDVVPSLDQSLASLHNLLVFQKSGCCTLLSQGLEQFHWQSYVLSNTLSDVCHVDYIFSQQATQASRTIFKRRQDLSARLERGNSTESRRVEGNIFGVVSQAVQKNNTATPHRQLHLFTLQPGIAVSDRPSLVHLETWNLPVAEDESDEDYRYDYDRATGRLHRSSCTGIDVLDLSRPRPHRVFGIHGHGLESASFVPLSRSLTLVSRDYSCGVYEMTYQTLQASKNLSFSRGNSSGQKRKRSELEEAKEDTPMKLIAYFTKIGSVVAATEHSLIVFAIKAGSNEPVRSGEAATKLINAIYRGGDELLSTNTIERESSQSSGSPWEDFKGKLDEYAAKEQGDKYEAEFNGFKTNAVSLKSKARLALSHIFRYAENQNYRQNWRDCSLVIKFLPRETFFWLIDNKQLSATDILAALKTQLNVIMTNQEPTTEDIVHAIAKYDPSLELLSQVILRPYRMGLKATVEATKIILESYDSENRDKKPSSSTQDAMHTSQILIPGSGLDSEIEEAQAAAQKELDQAVSALDNDVDSRGTALSTCLLWLGASYPHTEVVQAFKDQLTRTNLISLIQLMQFELERGGWTSQRVDDPSSEKEDTPEGIIVVICNLLNGLLDALGAGGWIGGIEDAEELGEATATFESLQSKAGIVLDVALESSFFDGFLADFFTYEKSLESQRNVTHTKRAITTVEDPQISRLLPLGVGSATGVPTDKVAATGEIRKRNLRDIANKESKRLGSYTYEKLRVPAM